jgi:hypothetical protein
MSLASSLLPLWLIQQLPEPHPHSLLARENDNWIVTTPGEERKSFQRLPEAHRYLLEAGGDFQIDSSAQGKSAFLSYPSERKQLMTLVLGTTDEDRLAILVSDYQESQEYAQQYSQKPEDFLSSYLFLDHHPAFWVRTPTLPWFWTTQGHCGGFYQCVSANGQSKIRFELEAGPHVVDDPEYGVEPEAFTHHSHDYRLDSLGSSFEEAIVQLASLVHKFYLPDGAEREDMGHYVPQWVQDGSRKSKELDRYLESSEE